MIKRLEYYKSLGLVTTVENQDFNDVTISDNIPDDEPIQARNLAKTVFRLYHNNSEGRQLLVISLYVKKPSDEQGTILVQGIKCPTFGVTEFNKIKYFVENIKIPTKENLHCILQDICNIPLTNIEDEKDDSYDSSSITAVDSSTKLKQFHEEERKPSTSNLRSRSLSGTRSKCIKEIDETIVTELATEIASNTARDTAEQQCEAMLQMFMKEVDQRLQEFRIQQYNEQKAVLSQLEEENNDLKSSLLNLKNENQKLTSQYTEMKKQSHKIEQQIRDLAKENMLLKSTIDTQSQTLHEILENKQHDQQTALYADKVKQASMKSNTNITSQQISIQNSPMSSSVPNPNLQHHVPISQGSRTMHNQNVQPRVGQNVQIIPSVHNTKQLHRMSIEPSIGALPVTPQQIPVHVSSMYNPLTTQADGEDENTPNPNYRYKVSPLDALLSTMINDSTDYLLLGDSCLSLIQPHKMNTGYYQYVQKVSVSGITVSDIGKWVEQLPINSNVNKIVLHVGVNDMHTGCLSESVWSNLISLLQFKFPHSHISMSSIIPTKSMKDLNVLINKSNEALSNACITKSVLFIDHTSTFRTANNAPKQALYQQGQQKHPSIKGMLLLARNLKYPGVDFKKFYEDSTKFKMDQNNFSLNKQMNPNMYDTPLQQNQKSSTNTPNQYFGQLDKLPHSHTKDRTDATKSPNDNSLPTNKNELATKITALLMEFLH